jgi:hypothetical protein
MSIPAYPIERRNGIGSATRASRPIATVMPLKTTALPAVLHRLLDRGLPARAVRALLPPARHNEERVVDRDPEADEDEQKLDDRRDIGRLRQQQERHEARHDRDERHHQRHEREEGGEDEAQDEQGAEAADQRLDDHTRPLVISAAVLHQRVDAGQSDGRSRY